jgi:hypothetical protein
MFLWEQKTANVIFQSTGYRQENLKQLMELIYLAAGQQMPTKKLKNSNVSDG